MGVTMEEGEVRVECFRARGGPSSFDKLIL
jgi:hypothetical protein